MSLNGLEAPAIQQAAEAVRSASAGWFLLKYATRDEIELYSSGTGHVDEAAAQISQYTDKSPLYGIVTNAGKRVFIRYVPAGTSRLLQARVKVHSEAVSSSFPHDTELSFSQANELNANALGAAPAAAEPSSTPLSPALSSTTQPTSPTPISAALKKLPSNPDSGSAHSSSANGEAAVKEEDGSNVPTSRTARLLADVRAGKLESHEVLAALRITPSHNSDRHLSDGSTEKSQDGVASARAEEMNRSTSRTSNEPLPAPMAPSLTSPSTSIDAARAPSRTSTSSNIDSYRAKAKLGPRPIQSNESGTSAPVASLPAGVSMPKPATQPTPTSPFEENFSFGHSMQPIVQAPASVTSATGVSIVGSGVTVPPLGQRKGSRSDLSSPRDQQDAEKLRLMRALEMQRKKQAKHKAGDGIGSAEPSPSLPRDTGSALMSDVDKFPTPRSGTDGAQGHRNAPPSLLDIKAANARHAATKSSPTLGSMANTPVSATHARPESGARTDQPKSAEAAPDSETQTPAQNNSSPAGSGTNATSLQESNMQVAEPADPQVSAGSESSVANSAKPDQNRAPTALDAAPTAATTDAKESQRTLAAASLPDAAAQKDTRNPAPIDTSQQDNHSPDENERTPVAEKEKEITPTAEKHKDHASVAETQEDALPKERYVRPESTISHADFNQHSSHVSISTSLLSGSSSILSELESSNVEMAHSMVMTKSPVISAFSRAIPAPESPLKGVEFSPAVAEEEESAAKPVPETAEPLSPRMDFASSGPSADELAAVAVADPGVAVNKSSIARKPVGGRVADTKAESPTDREESSRPGLTKASAAEEPVLESSAPPTSGMETSGTEVAYTAPVHTATTSVEDSAHTNNPMAEPSSTVTAGSGTRAADTTGESAGFPAMPASVPGSTLSAADTWIAPERTSSRFPPEGGIPAARSPSPSSYPEPVESLQELSSDKGKAREIAELPVAMPSHAGNEPSATEFQIMVAPDNQVLMGQPTIQTMPRYDPNPLPQSADGKVEDPMKAVIEAEMGIAPSASTLDSMADALDTPQQPLDENLDPLSVMKNSSPSNRRHPTVQPPHIWGGALRAASNPSDPPRHLSPIPDLSKMTRSASVASNSGPGVRPDSPSGAKKPGVGSRIADRIKALEKSSFSGASNPSPVYASSAVSVSSRKSSFNTPPGSSHEDTRKQSNSTSSGNIFARRFGTVHVSSAASDSGRSDRTIRPTPATAPESNREQVSKLPSSLDLQARPLPTTNKSSDSHNYSVPPSRDGAASISSHNKSKSSFSSWTGRRDSSETHRTGHSRQSSVESTNTNSDKKKDGKAKKLMKRVTGVLSPRKERSSPSFSEPILEGFEPEPPGTSGTSYSRRPTTRGTDNTTTTTSTAAAMAAAASAAASVANSAAVSRTNSRAPPRSNNVIVGEVNVQFPDTLLWKRRHVELESSGSIVLAPSSLDRNSKVASKRYHISEFNRPYVPDQEREELPYSIILDFKDSSTLQCACQNAVDQRNVLQALIQFHSSYAGGR